MFISLIFFVLFLYMYERTSTNMDDLLCLFHQSFLFYLLGFFFIYSVTCSIRHTKGPGKYVGLYRMSGISVVNLHKFHCISDIFRGADDNSLDSTHFHYHTSITFILKHLQLDQHLCRIDQKVISMKTHFNAIYLIHIYLLQDIYFVYN